MTSAAATTRQRLEEFVTSFDNPEISAMDRISRILQELPDEAARLRVMRWSFSKFSGEFKRPVETPTPPATAASMPVSSPVLAASRVHGARPDETAEEFTRQVAELQNFFGDR